MSEEVQTNKEDHVGKVLVVKLVTGEEIIGKVVAMQGGSLALENTLAIMLQESQKGFGFGFMPWGPLANNTKFINMNHIIYASEPKDSLLQAFNQATGAIVTPSKQIITG